MANLEFWQNGDSGYKVQKVIENNFKNINDQVNNISKNYVLDFKSSDWKNGVIFINNSSYLKQNPCVELYIKRGTKYSLVYGGYEITNSGIELQSDIAYEGRVVIR